MAALIAAIADPLAEWMLPYLAKDVEDLGRLRLVSRKFDSLVREYVEASPDLTFCKAHACGHILPRDSASRCLRCAESWERQILRLSEAAVSFQTEREKGLDGELYLSEATISRPKFGQILRPAAVVIYEHFVPLKVRAAHAWGEDGVLTRCVFPRHTLEYKLATRLDLALRENAEEWAPRTDDRRLVLGRLCGPDRTAVIRVVVPGQPFWAPDYRPPPAQDRPFSTAEQTSITLLLCLETLRPPGGSQTILRFVMSELRAV